MTTSRAAVHRTILVVDVAGFGALRRTNLHRLAVRDGLYRAVQRALGTVGVPWTECDHEDRGDGVLVVIPPAVAKSVLVEQLPDELVAALVEHNQAHVAEEQIKLRVALHAGEVHYDDHGVTGTSVNLAFRLLDAAALKDALARSTGVLALITSSWFFDEVVQHSRAANRDRYHRVTIVAKETNTVGWICLPDGPPTLPLARPEAPAGTGPVPVPRQLPAHTPHFVGRARELAQLSSSLDPVDQSGTVVITAIDGSAGIGKTALALHWAHRAKARFPDGQLHVNLRGYGSATPVAPGDVLVRFLYALGVDAQAIPAELDAQAALYRSMLVGRRVLVFLDNAASSEQVRPLLPGSPACSVIVTSRNRLEGLAVTEGAHRVTLDLLPADDAISLLANRIGRDRLDAEPDLTMELVELCAQLPLALNIAAARAAAHPGFSVRRLVDELRDERDRLDGLDLGDTDLNLRATFSWSYTMLTAAAARMFRLLGLHPGPDIDRRACAATAGVSTKQAGFLLRELHNAHLIEEHTPDRFRFHDLLRVYAAEQADREDPRPDRTVAAQRLLDHYLYTSLAADRCIDPSRQPITDIDQNSGAGAVPFSDYGAACRWCDAEHHVLIAAIDFAHRHGWYRHAWQLSWAIAVFLQRAGLYRLYATTQSTAAQAARQLDDRTGYATAMRHLANAHVRLGNYAEARKHGQVALATCREIGDRYGQARSHHILATSHSWEGSHCDARQHYCHAIDLFREIDHRGGQADTLSWLGRTHSQLGDHDEAVRCCRSALALCREVGDHHAEATCLDSLGYAYHHLGRHGTAVDNYHQSLALFRGLGDRYYEGTTSIHLADTHRATGDHQLAGKALRHALTIFEDLHHPFADEVRSALAELVSS